MRRYGLALWICGCVTFLGCSPPKSSPESQSDFTSGRITIVCPPDARVVVERAAREFERLYPKAHITLNSGTSRDAIAALFGARADMAVVTRDLLPEERRAAVQGRLGLDGYRFARDAAVLVVHPENPIQNMSLDDVRRIYAGQAGDWSQVGGRGGPILPVVQPAESDLTEFFVEQVMAGEPIRARSQPASSDDQVVATVRRERGAIGYVSMSHAQKGGQALRIAALKGLPYYLPDAESVYRGTYPMTRFFSMYVRSRGPMLANGFITYVTSIDGQKLVREAGLVPTAVPVRFVRRSPMVGAHSKGDSTPTP
jgi:phosphate transport system substrate-binding protein